MAEPTLRLAVRPATGSVVDVLVHARDAPGPSGYGLLFRDGEPESQVSEIDSLHLVDRDALLRFLAEIIAGTPGPVIVGCLRPRLARLRALLGAGPGTGPIAVDLADDA